MRIGFCSRSCPDLGALALAEYCLRAGAQTIDLRAEKQQAWEAAPTSVMRDRGLDIAFVGLTVTLGDTGRTLEDLSRTAARFPGEALKVFAKPGVNDPSTRDWTRRQVDALSEARSGPDRIMVECHKGKASLAELERLADTLGTTFVFDVQGVACLASESGDPFLAAATRLAPRVRAVQVKGFDWANPMVKRHRPLDDRDEQVLGELFGSIFCRDIHVTVETSIEEPVRDLQYLRDKILIDSLT